MASIYTKGQQKHAYLTIKSIAKEYEALSQNNPIMFAKIMQKIDARDFLKGKKQVEKASKDIFNKELAQAIESALQNGKVEVMPKDENKKLMNLFGIGVDSNGTINFKTYYLDDKKNRLKEILKSERIKIMYMKK